MEYLVLQLDYTYKNYGGQYVFNDKYSCKEMSYLLKIVYH